LVKNAKGEEETGEGESEARFRRQTAPSPLNPPFAAIKLHQDGAGLPFRSHTFPADKSGGKEVSYSVLLMPAQHVQGQPDCTAICSPVPARTQCGLSLIRSLQHLTGIQLIKKFLDFERRTSLFVLFTKYY